MRPTKRYDVRLTGRFEKGFQRLSVENQKMVLKTIAVIEEHSVEYRSLQTRKMTRKRKKGSKQLLESRVNDDIRLIWHYDDDDSIQILRVGHHDVEKMRKLQRY